VFLQLVERVRVPTPAELDWVRAELLCDGFTLIPAVLPPDLTDRIRAEVDGLLAGGSVGAELPGWRLDVEGSQPSGHGESGTFVDDLVRLDPLLALARALLGVECVPWRIEYPCRPGRTPAPTPARQDQVLCKDDFPGELAVTLWCPLVDVGIDEGAPEYASPNAVPGLLLEHVESPGKHSGSELSEPERFGFKPVPARCGDIVAHHSYAIRRCGPNRSGRHRQAIALSYRSSAHRMWPQR
jgi:hypothetical protein